MNVDNTWSVLFYIVMACCAVAGIAIVVAAKAQSGKD